MADFAQFNQKYLASILLIHLADFCFQSPLLMAYKILKIYILIHVFDSGLLSSKFLHLLQLFLEKVPEIDINDGQ